MNLFLRLCLNSLALLVADALIPGFRIEGVFSALLAALVLGLVNTFIKPVLILLTFPLTILTLGFFIFIINAFAFIMASWVVPGFTVYSFWGAFWGALITSLAGWLLNSISGREV